jgi:glycosyltransferase involved in cell wall biosynthesis
VRMPGALPRLELSNLLAAADVFVLLSSHEGRSHVLLEAMQAGLPIVASDVPGNRELLHDGEDALLVPREVPAVAEALRRLAGSPELRARLGVEARRRGARGWDEMVAGTLEVLERTRQRR